MMIITTGIISVIIVVCTVIMYLLLDSSINRRIAKLNLSEEEQIYDDEDEERSMSKQEGILLDLGEFVLNLADTNARRYIKVAAALELSKTTEELEANNKTTQRKKQNRLTAIPINRLTLMGKLLPKWKDINLLSVIQ